ncbi:MAG: NmrA family NAD(P)-binding protein [Flavipsychrobacter sp.]
MKIVVTGSLGHIGRPLTNELVKNGHEVTVISSNAARGREIEAMGAKAAIGTIEDVNFLADTFRGADIVYTMVPPPNFHKADANHEDTWLQIGKNYAAAIQEADVQRVIHLSSIGAHLAKGSGLIRVHYEIEQLFNEQLAHVAITFMRPTAFNYNLLAFIPTIKNAGAIISNYGGNDIVPWVSPIDIAAAIAEEIAMPAEHRRVRYVASDDELSCTEIASILGAAIGKPDLQWNVIPDAQLLNILEHAGMPASIAAPYVEMNAAIHSGLLQEDYYRNRPVLGKVKLADFAKEFAHAFHQK